MGGIEAPVIPRLGASMHQKHQGLRPLLREWSAREVNRQPPAVPGLEAESLHGRQGVGVELGLNGKQLAVLLLVTIPEPILRPLLIGTDHHQPDPITEITIHNPKIVSASQPLQGRQIGFQSRIQHHLATA